MSKRLLSLLLLLVLLLPSVAPYSAAQEPLNASTQGFHSSPMMFIENVGQWEAGARFQVRGDNTMLWLADDALWLTVLERSADDAGDFRADLSARSEPDRANAERDNESRQAANVKVSFVGANPHPHIETFNRLDTVVSYFIGNDPEKWRPDVPIWGGVRYVALYPGVDLEITSDGGQMVQRLVTRPGADLNAVQLRVEGADAVTADGNGLHLATAAGEAIQPLLRADGFQIVGAQVQPRGTQGFDVVAPFAAPNFNPISPDTSSPQLAIPRSAKDAAANPPSVADSPTDLLYGTFLGGNNNDYGNGIAVDGVGSVYVTGETASGNFPTMPGAIDTSYNGGSYYGDAFVVKLNPDGSGLAYATFLGGSSDDHGNDIAVDGAGSAYVTGSTASSGFPTTPGAFDTSFDGSGDAFVAKLNPTGSGLAYATFLGGRSNGIGIAVDGTGSAYLTGLTTSADFPATLGAFDTSFNGVSDAFVAKLNPAGSGLTYATFLGGSSDGWGTRIAVDGAGSAYVTGATRSSDFPTTTGAFDTSHNGDNDVFVVKLNPDGSGLAYATFLGGSGYDFGTGIAVDGAGSAYVAGYTASGDFPTTVGTFDTSYNGGTYDAVVIKLSPDGSGLAYATFLGGSGNDAGSNIAIDGAGSVYLAGATWSTDFPITGGAFDTSFNGDPYDAFVVRLNPAGSRLAYATFLGGSSLDPGQDIAVDVTGSIYVIGDTRSTDFPTSPGAFDTSYNGGDWDAFAVKLALRTTETVTAPFSNGPNGVQTAGFYSGAVNLVISGVGQASATSYSDAFYVYTDNAGNPLSNPSSVGWDLCIDGTRHTSYINPTPPYDPTHVYAVTIEVADNHRLWFGVCDTMTGDNTGAYTVELTPGGYSISGRVTDGSGGFIADVTVSAGAAGSVTTDDSGAYTLGELAAGTYTLTPSTSGYTFSPSSLTVTVPPDATGQDFIAVPITYSVEGKVTDSGGAALADVSISDGAGHTSATDAEGNYVLTGLTAGTHTITPTKDGYTLTPASRTVTVPPDAMGQDFVGTPNVKIKYIEVTQGIQCLDNPDCFGDPSSSSTSQQMYDDYCGADNSNCNNAVPLIAAKPTLVRVYVDCAWGCDTLKDKAEIRGYSSSGELTPVLTPFGEFVSVDGISKQRGNLRYTLNFSLPNEWLSGAVTLRATVGPTTQDGLITFLSGNPVRIAYLGMAYAPAEPYGGNTMYFPDFNTMWEGHSDLVGIYPVSSADVTYVYQPGFEQVIKTDYQCTEYACTAETDYLKALNTFWERMDREGKWRDGIRPDRLYGWVPQAAMADNTCGIADTKWSSGKGRVAAGVDIGCGAETLAHEIGHLLDSEGLRHTPNLSPDLDPACAAVPGGSAQDYPEYPEYKSGSIAEWAAKAESGSFQLLDPTRTYDFMSYCSPEWVSPFNYVKLMHKFDTVTGQLSSISSVSEQRQFLVSGVINSSGPTASLDALFDITSAVLPDDSTGTAYCLELRNAADAVLDSRCFDLSFTNPETGEPISAKGFSYALPYPDGTQAVVLTHSGTEVTRMAASAGAPTVQVVSPNGGETWGASGTYNITWTGSDSDDNELHYAISLSADDGVTWNPLVLDTTDTEWTVDASALPGSSQAKVRVQASDGFHTAVDASDATFTIGSKVPQTVILAPQVAVTVMLGTPLLLRGYGTDLEDGTLTGAALAWSSSLDGSLATGGEASVTLSEGQHTVTLTVTDSDNNTSIATVDVQVVVPRPPEAPQVDITWEETGLTLSWPHVATNVDLYQVWRSPAPNFDAYQASSTGIEVAVPDGADTGTIIHYLDTEALADPGISYYYFVRAISVDGMMSSGSNPVGVFNFALVPGAQ